MPEDPIEKIRIKAEKFLPSDIFREDVQRGIRSKGEHLFYRLEMPSDDAFEKIDEFNDIIQQSEFADEINVRNLNHPEDTQEFMFLYNAIFLAAPDPTREINIEEAQSFPEDRTFIATLWGDLTMAGFVYVVIEKDPMGSGEMVGAIAGIGVLPKYRGKKLGLLLIKHAIEYFKDKNIEKLICEVYEKNQPSLNMFQKLGMEIVGEMILEREQPSSQGS